MRYDPYRRTIHNEDDFIDAVAEVKTYVSTFTDNWIEKHGTPPDLDDFIETYPRWDEEILYDSINQEIKRITALTMKERTQ